MRIILCKENLYQYFIFFRFSVLAFLCRALILPTAAGSEWAEIRAFPSTGERWAEPSSREANSLQVPEPWDSLLGFQGSRICHLQGVVLERGLWGARYDVPCGWNRNSAPSRTFWPPRSGLWCAEWSSAALRGCLHKAGLERLLIQTCIITSEKTESTANCFPAFTPQ